MLVEFYGQNFGCFRDEFRLSMLATDIDPNSDRGIVKVRVDGDAEPLRLLRAVAIYGPNASGKSTVLRAAAALRHLIGESATLESDAMLAPYEPFAVGADGKPVRLGITAVIDNTVYDYEVQFLRSHFTSERLELWHADGEATVLLDRIGQKVSGQWGDDPQFALISKDFRPNALLLSLADRLAPALAKNIAVGLRRLLEPYPSIPARFGFFNRDDAARLAYEDRNFADWLASRLKSADVGVTGLKTEEFETPARFPADDDGERKADGANRINKRKSYRISLTHGTPDRGFEVPYRRESLGTRKLVELAPLLYQLAHAKQPMAALVDEIHESLHPKLLEGLIRNFNCDTPMEQVRGQLVFATHETALLDGEAWTAVLRRDQIYLTEKDASGAARLYSIAEFKERNNLNIRRRYLQGRYGALPSLGVFDG
ncbi:MAG: AAA family ATPase [Planctomycetia bacterium]|nr:AAA family ATPase [Planctomycetia bacterium]